MAPPTAVPFVQHTAAAAAAAVPKHCAAISHHYRKITAQLLMHMMQDMIERETQEAMVPTHYVQAGLEKAGHIPVNLLSHNRE